MHKVRRNDAWDGKLPIAKQLTFSSFSDYYYDVWARNSERPYQIVFLPGYVPPADLDRSSKDAMWLDGEVTSVLPVWDAWSAIALFEVIYECMDYQGSSPFIKVRDTKSGDFVEDRRSTEALRLRPRRWKGMHNKEVYNHVLDLRMWSFMFTSEEDSVNYPETTELYHALIYPSRESQGPKDIKRRNFEAERDGITKQKLEELQRNWAGRGNAVLTEGPPARHVPALIDADRPDIEINSLSLITTSAKVAEMSLKDFSGKPRPKSFLQYGKRLD
jgi:hypothetical protein